MMINNKCFITDDNYINMDYPADKTITELFKEQVKKIPDSYALISSSQKLTYKELDIKSDNIAIILKEKGVSKDNIVGILCEKSCEMIISILGILKSGGSYMIIDPEYPENRIKYMLENIGVDILLKQSNIYLDNLFNGKMVDIDNGILSEYSGNNLKSINSSKDLAYVIYTSGSTGLPKGVMVEHRNLINTVYFLNKTIYTGSKNKVLQFFNPGFTVCYQEIFVSLLFGEELHIINQNIRENIGNLLDYIKKMEINILFLPTSYLKVLSNESEFFSKFPDTIKHIITAGEQLVITDKFINYLKKNNISLHNNYGTSETNMATIYTVDDNVNGIPPIGKPIANTHVYILDKNLNMQSAGNEGEIFISGDSVSRGYINNPTLTAEKFIKNPFIKDSLMYSTGDIGKVLPDGNIKFLGRSDFQVKIRGFRIETGEIEYHLLKYNLLKEVAVVAKQETSNIQYLYAFIVSSKKISVNELREYLKNRLPEYMIPTHIIQLDKLPKLPTGKINRKKLIECNIDQINNDYHNKFNYDNLNSESLTKTKLKNIIKDITGTNFCYINENENFSNYSIDSLTFIKLVSIVQNEFNIEFDNKYLNVKKFQNIESFISYIENKIKSN